MRRSGSSIASENRPIANALSSRAPCSSLSGAKPSIDRRAISTSPATEALCRTIYAPPSRDICSFPVTDDGIAFNGEAIRIESIRDQDEYDGLRARLEATLDSARIPVQIDVGFGNAIEPPPTDANYPVLLDAPRPQIRVYPREAVMAEKLHAMVVFGEQNSRYKDFYDLHALVQHFDFDGERLVRAVGATFERRGTTITQAAPIALTPRFYADAGRAEEWAGYRNRNALPGAPSDFGRVGDRLLAFFGEPWAAMAHGAAFTGTWPAGGPWQR